MGTKNDIKNIDMKGFTLSMALVDALPVLFFAGSSIIISMMFNNILFTIGACLCILAGLGKVLWKIILALKKKNILILNRQLRFIMPLGFALIILSLILNRKAVSLSAIGHALVGFPSAIFFAIGIMGMAAMSVFARKLDGTDPRSNWIEQLTNTAAQGAFFVGLLLLWLN